MFTYCPCSICTQTCNDGYALDDGSRTSSLTCDTYGGWKNGMEFQMCRGSSGIIHVYMFRMSVYLSYISFESFHIHSFSLSLTIQFLCSGFHGWITIFILVRLKLTINDSKLREKNIYFVNLQRILILSAVVPSTSTQTGNCHHIHSVKDCPSDGDFADCHRCDHFISCAPDGAFLRRCPPTTFWDDIAKQCLLQSSTCSQ